MAGIYDVASLRRLAEANGFQGNDEQLILETARREKRDPADLARYLGYDLGGKWGTRASAAIDSYQANMYGLGEAVTGADWFRSGRRANDAASGLQREIARSQGAISSYKDVGGVGDALDYVGGLAIDSAPYLAEALVGGLAVRGLSTGLRGIAQAGRAADASVDAVRAGQAADAALTQRSLLGGAAASYPSAVGDILSNQRDASADGDTMDLGAALIGGVPYAAANMFGLEGLAARGSLGRGLAGLDTASAAKRIAGNVGMTAGVEGLSETFQEGINQGFGRMATNPNERMFSPEAMERYGESFVGGAALGGLMGAPGANRRSQGYYDREQMQGAEDRERQAQELAEQKRGLDLLNRRPDFELAPDDGTYAGQPERSDIGGADWGQGGTPATQYDMFDARGNPTYGADNFNAMGAVADVADRLGQPATFNPSTLDALAGVRPPAPARPQDFSAAMNEPGQRFSDANGIERQGTRLDDYERQLGITQEVQRKAAEQKAETARVAGILGGKPGEKAVNLFKQLEALAETDAITSDELSTYAAMLSNSKYGAVQALIKDKQSAAQQPGVPGPTGVTGSPVASPSNQPGGSPGAERPVGAPAAPPVVPGANMAGTSGGTNTGVSAPGRNGDGRGAGALATLTQQLVNSGVDLDAPIEVRTGGGKLVTKTRRDVVNSLANADATDRIIVGALMARAAGKTLTLAQIGDLVGRAPGLSPITAQAVQKRMDKFGITEDSINAATGSSVSTVSESELGGDLSEGGFRTSESLGDATNDGVVDDGATAKQRKLAQEASQLIKSAEGTAKDRASAAVDDFLKPVVSEDERTTAETRARAEIQRQLVKDLQDPAFAAAWPAARNAWENGKLDSTPGWDALSPGVRYAWALEHAGLERESATPKEIGAILRDYETDLTGGKLANTSTDAAIAELESVRRAASGSAEPDTGNGQIGDAARGDSRALERPAVPDEQLVIGDARTSRATVTRKPQLNREVLNAPAPPEPPKRTPGKLTLKPKAPPAPAPSPPADYSKYAGLTTAPEEIAIVDGPSVTIGGTDAVQTLTAMDQKESALEAILTCVKKGA